MSNTSYMHTYIMLYMHTIHSYRLVIYVEFCTSVTCNCFFAKWFYSTGLEAMASSVSNVDIHKIVSSILILQIMHAVLDIEYKTFRRVRADLNHAVEG